MKRLVVTDIEGTTSAISFVKEVLFPYARRELPGFVRERSGDPSVQRWLDEVRGTEEARSLDQVVEILLGWIDADRKHTALKALQGMVWERGFSKGDFQAHVYDDAAEALTRWRADGHLLHVYSSGSVHAQRLFFGHTVRGDLSPLFSGHFDTEVGEKRAAASYQSISAALAAPGSHLLFLSDVVEELDAAREAGWSTVLVDRIEDYPAPRLGGATHGHTRARSFDDITP